jgi:hypothetical protein
VFRADSAGVLPIVVLPIVEERAGGVRWLTVGRENADAEGLTDAGLEFAPTLLCAVGVAFGRLMVEAPLKLVGVSLTELPATDRPLAKLDRDIARPAVLAYLGNEPRRPA